LKNRLNPIVESVQTPTATNDTNDPKPSQDQAGWRRRGPHRHSRAIAAIARARPTGHRITSQICTEGCDPSDAATERPTPSRKKAAAINKPAVIVSTNACRYLLA